MIREPRYLVVGNRPWNRLVFEEVISHFPGKWHFVSRADDMTPENVAKIDPRYVFFLHWSNKVPSAVLDSSECVCFHMTDVPYGRGGSPLQNLIARGHQQTKLTALRMIENFDAGPVYLKEDLSLEGSAEEIYLRASYLSAQMIQDIIEGCIEPVPQAGDPTIFQRRKPLESRIPSLDGLTALFDFIRMLDAEGYPHAYLEHEGFRYQFTGAALRGGRIITDIAITPVRESR